MTRGILALLALSLLVAACGRPGGRIGPGPPDQITYPRSYPNR
jgi:hypothetical protein